jgi:hypothetical protein
MTMPVHSRNSLYGLELDFDWEAQLGAIRASLSALDRVRSERQTRFATLKKEMEGLTGSAYYHAESEYGELFEEAVYGDATYSMGALGMLAPFVESIFHQALLAIGSKLDRLTDGQRHERWRTAHEVRWDCHYVLSGGKVVKNLTRGIIQASEAIGLLSHLPKDLGPRLEALFLYRNKMFHHGLEWPKKERDRFAETKKQWPKEWFEQASINGEPWLFYLTERFVADTVLLIDQILDGIGAFIGDNRTKLFPPVDAPAWMLDKMREQNG